MDEDILEEALGSSPFSPRHLALPTTGCHEGEGDILRCPALSSVVVLGGFALGVLVSAKLEPDLPVWQKVCSPLKRPVLASQGNSIACPNGRPVAWLSRGRSET